MPGGAPDQRHGDDEAEIAGDQAGADAVFQGTRLGAVVEILEMAHLSQRLVKQNFALAFTYNALTVPLAVLGLLRPAAFLWVLCSGQYDNLDGAAQRILFDDDDGDEDTRG